MKRRDVLGGALAGAVLAATPALAHPPGGPRPPGAAGVHWCRVDPVFQIGGETAHLYVAANVDTMRQARALASGPTTVALAVPAGVAARHLAGDDGFGFGYEVDVVHAADLDGTGEVLPVRVKVTVPMAQDGVPVPVPVRAEFVPRGRGADRGEGGAADGRLRPGSGEGTANAEIAFLAA